MERNLRKTRVGKVVSNKMDKTSRIKEVRKNIARIQTVIAQKNA